jgi:chromosome segregation ATPase
VLRARLKHRAPAPGTSASPTSTYDRVLDTARQLAELERLRAQDAAYIRLLEQGRATLVRDAHAGARERAATSTSAASTVAHEEQQQQRRKADEAERSMKAERERAERAEMRARALEEALSAARARVAELEGEVESERRRREEWESGLEQLAMGGPGTGPSAVAVARL